MSDSIKKRLQPVRRLFVLGVCTITIIIAGSLFWNITREMEVTEHFAGIEAVSNYNKDLLYRRWAAAHGGVYIPVTEQSPPNPHLAHIPERDITTPSGKSLTLINPAYMTRQVHELAQAQYGTRGHITSLNPIRPQNTPDAWEHAALLSFENGAMEQASIELMDGKPFLRFMHPMITERPCLKCHADQGYKEGDIRGGISVSVPMDAYNAVKTENIRALLISHIFMLVLMVAAGAIVYRKFHQDMSARLVAEKTLFESEERYRRLAEAAFEVVAISRNGQIIDISKQIESIYGWTPEEFKEQDFRSIIHPDDLPMVEQNIRENHPGPYQHRGIRKDGSVVHLEVRAETLSIHDKPHRMTVIRDISNLKQMQELLRHAEKMQAIGQLAGGIAHDFNNILGAIIGYADMALDDVPLDDELRNKLQQILKAADRAEHLVSQILTFSRRDNPHRQTMLLKPLITEVLELLKAVIPSSVQTQIALENDTKPISADPAQIHEVIMNLTTNAVDAMREKGILGIALYENQLTAPLESPAGTAAPGFYSVIEVSDSGTGMDEATRRRIFDPFFTTKPVGKGTGMGLSVVLGIVQSHGGAVTVESTPDKGTVFRIYLPTVDAGLNAPSIPPDRYQAGTEHILFVDDEEMMVRMARTMLERRGYTITAVTDPLEAIALLRNTPNDFDLLITDQTMPAMTGMDLSRAALEIRPNLPIILCTGYSTAANPKDTLNIGIKRFCQKPIKPKELTAIIREILDDPKTSNQ